MSLHSLLSLCTVNKFWHRCTPMSWYKITLHLLSSIWHLQWNPHNLSFEHTYIKPRVNKRPQGYSCEDDNAYKNHVILVQRQTARDILLAQKVTHEHLTHDTVVARSPTHKTLMVEKKKKVAFISVLFVWMPACVICVCFVQCLIVIIRYGCHERRISN